MQFNQKNNNSPLNSKKLKKINLQFRLDNISLFFMFYSVGIYGYPAISMQFNSVSGLIFRIFLSLIIFSILILWVISIYNYSENNHKLKPLIYAITLKDITSFAIIYIFLVIVKHKELSSSITGDEINIYDNTLEISRFMMQKAVLTNILFQHVPARFILAIFQLIIISLIIFLSIKLIRFNSKVKLTFLVVITITLNFIHNYYLGGGSLYPNIETLPYFFSSPILLIANISPKYIAIAMFTLFLQIIYRLTFMAIKHNWLRILLIIFIAELNIFTDIVTSLNHGVYYIYLFTIFLILFDKDKYISKNLILFILVFAIFRPTLILLLFFSALYRLFSSKNINISKTILSNYRNHYFIFLPQYMILAISMLSISAYAYFDPKPKPSFSDNLDLWIKNIANLDYQSLAFLIVGITFVFKLKKYYIVLLMALSFITYLVTAPKGNLSNPIYKAEVLSPFLIFFVVLIFINISNALINHQNNFKVIKIKIFILLTSFFLLYLFYFNNKQLSFPNYSWDPKYEQFQSGEINENNNYNSSPYISFGKVKYNQEALNFAANSNCRFLDIVYKGSMFLDTDISAVDLINLANPLHIDTSELISNRDVKCVVVGNYPNEKFVKDNNKFKLNFTLLKIFYQDNLGTYLRIYIR